MLAHVNDALASGTRRLATSTSTSVLLIGAIGPLGNAVLRALAGNPRWQPLQLAVRAPLLATFDGITPVALDAARADVAVVVFDHSRAADGREAAIERCAPEALAELARQLLSRGTKALVVVTPQQEASLPQALRAGLLDLDEQSLASLSFEHLLLIRPARRDSPALAPASSLQRVADAVLDTLRVMVPQQEQPVLARKVAAFVACAMQTLPQAAPGIYIAAANTVWQSAQQASPLAQVRAWLRIADKQAMASPPAAAHVHQAAAPAVKPA